MHNQLLRGRRGTRPKPDLRVLWAPELAIDDGLQPLDGDDGGLKQRHMSVVAHGRVMQICLVLDGLHGLANVV